MKATSPAPSLMIVVAFFAVGCAGAGGELSEGDRIAVRNLNEVYTSAWLRDDREAVMDLFADGAVLIPHRGDPAVEGREAIRAFFWPTEGPLAVVTGFDMVTHDIGGNDRIAYVRGRFSLGFYLDGEEERESFANEGNFVMIVQKDATGSWRISQYIWNDSPQTH